jgi:hypothetical protein
MTSRSVWSVWSAMCPARAFPSASTRCTVPVSPASSRRRRRSGPRCSLTASVTSALRATAPRSPSLVGDVGRTAARAERGGEPEARNLRPVRGVVRDGARAVGLGPAQQRRRAVSSSPSAMALPAAPAHLRAIRAEQDGSGAQRSIGLAKDGGAGRVALVETACDQPGQAEVRQLVLADRTRSGGGTGSAGPPRGRSPGDLDALPVGDDLMVGRTRARPRRPHGASEPGSRAFRSSAPGAAAQSDGPRGARGSAPGARGPAARSELDILLRRSSRPAASSLSSTRRFRCRLSLPRPWPALPRTYVAPFALVRWRPQAGRCTALADIPSTSPATDSRRSRRHGDLVRSATTPPWSLRGLPSWTRNTSRR